jgi:hypothetical protein
MKSRSWFFTWLKVLVCCWSVCWGSVNALADTKKGWRCEVCCPPTGCTYLVQQYYRYTAVSHVSNGNLLYTAQVPPKNSMMNSVNLLGDLNGLLADSGEMAAIQSALLSNLTKQSTSAGVAQGLVPYGNTVPQSQFDQELAQTSDSICAHHRLESVRPRQ